MMAVFTAAEAIDIALRLEKNGQAFYEAAARKFDDPQVKELMKDLAAWEQKHYDTFQELADQMKIEEPTLLTGPYWEDYDLYVQAALDSSLLHGPDKAVALVDGIESAEDALRMALGFEKDAQLFYYDLRDMMPESEREAVDTIIREEKGHARKLATLLRTGSTSI
jgi:rubrerythrin